MKSYRLGVERRIQGLAVRGFSVQWISDRTGISVNTLKNIRNGLSVHVDEDIRNRVRNAVFESLSLPEPEGVEAERSKTLAQKNEWFPLGSWDDPDDVRCRPDDPESDPVDEETSERISKIRRVHGYTMRDISSKSGVSSASLRHAMRGTGRLRDTTRDRINEFCDAYDPD